MEICLSADFLQNKIVLQSINKNKIFTSNYPFHRVIIIIIDIQYSLLYCNFPYRHSLCHKHPPIMPYGAPAPSVLLCMSNFGPPQATNESCMIEMSAKCELGI